MVDFIHEYHAHIFLAALITTTITIIFPCSDICTTIWDNFDDNFHFLSFHWSKTIEREKGRDIIRI